MSWAIGCHGAVVSPVVCVHFKNFTNYSINGVMKWNGTQ